MENAITNTYSNKVAYLCLPPPPSSLTTSQRGHDGLRKNKLTIMTPWQLLNRRIAAFLSLTLRLQSAAELPSRRHGHPQHHRQGPVEMLGSPCDISNYPYDFPYQEDMLLGCQKELCWSPRSGGGHHLVGLVDQQSSF